MIGNCLTVGLIVGLVGNLFQLFDIQAVESLVVKPSGFVPEGRDSISDTTKDPPSACGVRARKIRGSESPVISR